MSFQSFLLVLALGFWLGLWLGPAITRALQAMHRRRLKPRLLLRPADSHEDGGAAPSDKQP